MITNNQVSSLTDAELKYHTEIAETNLVFALSVTIT